MPFPATRQQVRPSPEAEKRLREQDQLSAAYNRHRRQRIDALCAGEHGERVKALLRFLRRMTLGSGRALIERVEAADWARAMPADERHLLLSIINGAIRLMREREGLTPVDDPLWDEPPNVSMQIKTLLEVC